MFPQFRTLEKQNKEKNNLSVSYFKEMLCHCPNISSWGTFSLICILSDCCRSIAIQQIGKHALNCFVVEFSSLELWETKPNKCHLRAKTGTFKDTLTYLTQQHTTLFLIVSSNNLAKVNISHEHHRLIKYCDLRRA